MEEEAPPVRRRRGRCAGTRPWASDTTSRSAACDRVVGDPERAREHVGRPARQRRERGVGAGEAVGRFVERAVAGRARRRRRPRRARRRGRGGWRGRAATSPPPRACGRRPAACWTSTRRRAVTDDAVALTISRTRMGPHRTGTLRSGRAQSCPQSGRRARALTAEIVECRACPRLVEWRERVAREKRAAFRDEEYWGRPVPGFGDPEARVLIVGLAPAAHGGNRTGPGLHRRPVGRLPVRRAAPHRASPTSRLGQRRRRPGAARRLRRGRGALRAAGEQADARRARPVPAVPRARARAARTGAGDRRARGVRATRRPCARARDAAGRRCRRRVRSSRHGVEVDADRVDVVGCFHPSQQNTFTGKLTEPMLDAVFARARALSSV